MAVVTGKKSTDKAPSPKKSPKPVPVNERDVIYKELEVKVAVGDAALTAEIAKQLLGWEYVDAKDASCTAELTPLTGKNVRLLNNTRNRFLTPSWLLTLKQEHLQKRWRMNGEAIVIGMTGNILSGQHRLISLILAEIERTDGKQKLHWEENWPTPVTMDTLLVFGVTEDDDTFKTLNCGKPGTFAEVLFRSEHLGKFKSADRKNIARMTDYAIRFLWHRTGESADAFHPRRTHGEMMDFIERHPKILKAVKHIYEENQTGKDSDGKALPPSIGRWVSPGYAAAILYLMAASGTDPDDGYLHSDRTEKKLDLKQWDKAEKFWIALSRGVGGEFKGVCNALSKLNSPDGEKRSSLAEKIAVLCNAWAKFAEAGEAPKEEDVELKEEHYTEDNGDKVFTYCPMFGGIDLGAKPPKVKEENNNKDDDLEDDLEETLATKSPEAIRNEKEAKRKKQLEMSKIEAKTSQGVNFLMKEWNEKKAKVEGCDILFDKSNTTGNYTTFDADVVAKVLGVKVDNATDSSNPRVVVKSADFNEAVAKLTKAKHRVAVASETRTGPGPKDKRTDIVEVKPKAAAKPVSRK